MNAKAISCWFLTLALVGCGDFVHHERLTGPFVFVVVYGAEELRSVARYEGHGISVGRIGPVVTDAGWSTNYIVAAVRPEGKPGTAPSYFYLDIAKDSTVGDQYQAVTSPLAKDEFDKAKQKLGLPEFSRHFPNLR